jgi:WXG100 family type VII secretion target
MASNVIQVDYEKLDEIKRSFEQQAGQCQEMAARLRQRVDPLESGGWAGEGASAFFNEMNTEVFPSLQRLPESLGEGASVTTKIAQLFREAEEATKPTSGLFPGGIEPPTRSSVRTINAGGQQGQKSPPARPLSDKEIKAAQNYNEKNEKYSVDFVRRLERTLGLPYSPESENGQFSKALIDRIARYQDSKGLKDVDGKVGQETLDKLKEDYPDVFVDRLTGPGKVGRQIISTDATEAELYDFYKGVVESNHGVWRSEAGQVNIVGVRGMQAGEQVPNDFKQSNDTMAVIWTDSEGKKHVMQRLGSVDPGRVRKPKATGVAHIKDGSYVYALDYHGKRKGYADSPSGVGTRKDFDDLYDDLPEGDRHVGFTQKGSYTALRQVTPVTVYRDKDPKGHRQHGYIEPGEMVEDRGMFAINIHYTREGNPWSAGCQVIAGAKEYNDFIGAIKKGTNTKDLPYTVIDASKL